MKKKSLMAAVVLTAGMIFSISCSGGKKNKPADEGPSSFIEVKIGGMTCTGCEQTIQRNVGKLKGVKSVKATFTDGKAIVEYFPSLVDTADMRKAITGSGYSVEHFTANP